MYLLFIYFFSNYILYNNKISVIGLAAVQLSAKNAAKAEYKGARDLLTATQRYLQNILQISEDSPNYNTFCEEYVKDVKECI